MDKNQLKHIIKEEYQNVKSFMEDKYGFTPELGKVISNPYAKSFVNEVSEPEVISQLRDIVNKKQNKKIKDPKSGKMMRVDMFSASAIVKVYDAVNKSNKEKFSKLSLPKMVNVAFTVMKKESVNEGYGDWVKAKNLTDIIKLSKQKKNATFYVTDDNNSRIGTFYLKNGKFAKATSANPNYDFQKNKTNLKDRSDVIYKYKIDESVNEAKFMDKNKKFKVYDKLKKGDKIRIKFGNAIRKDNETVLVVTKGKTKVGKAQVERIILKNPKNPNGVKYYLYNRDGNVSLAKGDMAAVIVDMIPESIDESVNEGMFKTIDQIRQDSKDARDFIKNVFSDPDFKDMKNDREFLKYLKSIYEGFSSDAQRRAAFASGYKAKGKKDKKESIEEYDVENYQDVKEFIEFMREYEKDPYALNPTVNEAEYQGRDVKLGKIMQGDVKKFKVYVKNPKGNVVKVNFGHGGSSAKGKTMKIKKSNPERRKAFRARHNCDNPGPRHKARYWACRTW